MSAGECKSSSNSDSSGMGGSRGSFLCEGAKWKVQFISEEDALRSVGSRDADRRKRGRGNDEKSSRKRCLSVKLNGQQVDPSKASGSIAQSSSSNVMDRRYGRVRYDNSFSIEGHDGGTATLILHCEAEIDGTCKVNSKSLKKGDNQVLKVGDRVHFSFNHNDDNNYAEYIIEEDDSISGYKLKAPGDNTPLQQSNGNRYESDDISSSVRPLEASQEAATVSEALSERVRQMETLMECPICAGFMVNPILTVPCGHSFCSTCWNGLGLTPHCPSCRSIVTDTALNRGLNSFIELIIAAGPTHNSVVENSCLDAEDVAHYRLRAPHCHSSYSPPCTVHFETTTSQNLNNISSRAPTFEGALRRNNLPSSQQDRRSRKRVVIDLT